MVVVATAPVRDLPGPVSPDSVSFDEIVHGTGRAAGLRLGAGCGSGTGSGGEGQATPAVTLVPDGPAAHFRRIVGVLSYQIGNVLSTVAFALFLFLAVGPHLFPYQTMTMLTGSMVPTINPGDVAVDTRTSIYDLKPGDIITYRIPVEDHRIVSHRIITVTTETNGSVTVQTKGDANPSNDPWTANFTSGTMWRVDTVIPKIGEGIRFFREPGVARVTVYVAPVVGAVLALSIIWTPRRRSNKQPDPHDIQYHQSPFAKEPTR
ncbi:signal peptidase I [Kineosporia sp. NBRC 101731]|uniref:signal peptidase I n=1 Tax=Kineosporia sp. NBRC 101731 TaxID=3032199 RepID=UPI0024A52102|nr:signal peptidase I [Kineosporia sp. NBRC 101731]GLY27455.1 hypothetical protein Kisp02_08200 [Kineosporia sp. NBRC 101731]